MNSRLSDEEVSRMSNSEEVLIAWTTIPTSMDGSAFARTLVEDGLAACVSLYPKGYSTYTWTGKTVVEAESAVMIKTTRLRVDSLEHRILELHDHDVPEFIVTNVTDGYPPYLDWVRRAVNEVGPE